MPTEPPPIAEQLARLLNEVGMSQRELARRIAGQTGYKNEEVFRRRWNARLRWIQKVLGGDVTTPIPASLRSIEEATGSSGYFKVPAREPRQAKATREATHSRRLAELSAAFDDLASAHEDLEVAHKALQRRVAALERQRGGPRTGSAGA